MRYQRYRGRRSSGFSPVAIFFLIMILLCASLLAVIFWRHAAKTPPVVQPSSNRSPDLAPISTAASPTVEPSPSEEPVELPWNLTLVNAAHPLPEDFAVVTETLKNGKSFDARAIGALSDMINACWAAGLQPLVCSAYRSVDDQTALFQEQLDRLLASGLSYDEARAAAAQEIAIPGTSEHSLGLAADICALSYQNLDSAQADTEEQKWLMAHCAEYGFILRYPKDKQEITGIIFEPWHYRYVGKEAAQVITEEGLCLEEYLAREYGVD